MAIKRILVIEDEKDILDMISINLIRAGYQVSAALSGSDGLEKLSKTKFDLLLSDNCLPDGLGSDLIQQLHASTVDVNMKTVLMTAGADMDPWDDDLIADGLLAKPFSIRELLLLIERMLVEPVNKAPQYIVSRASKCEELKAYD